MRRACMGWWRRAGLMLGLALAAAAVAAQQAVEVPSLDPPGGPALRMPAFWFPTAATVPSPAIVLLHGCGGPYDHAGRLASRMRDYARLLNAEGWHVLVTDSFTARGQREICTQKLGTRTVTQAQRRLDALGALAWLAAQPEVDASRLALLGWSNGGSTVLASTNASVASVAQAATKPRAAAAFYPGCMEELGHGYRPVAPLLLLVGALDDWTPPQFCEQLAAEAGAVPPVQLSVYEGAYHGFDGEAPLRVRSDVPNGAHPGAGVHVGGDAAARDASRRRLLEFLREQLK